MDTDINNFGCKSFVTHTTGLVERIKKMADPAYICLSCGKTFQEWELDVCERCGHIRCPRIIGKGNCGGEVSTIEEYDKAMKANAE